MSDRGEPIAIIGSGCRFPGDATTPSKLWELLRAPQDLLAPLVDRFNAQGWYHPNGTYHGHANVQASYQLAGEGVTRRFDAGFFGINAIEASTMDPQMRLLLETVYEALETAGQSIEGLQGSDTAVYSGLMLAPYEHMMARDIDSLGTYHVSGTSRAMMSNRLSYFFDWHGPSMTIDTACSSSLIAVHQAVHQLRSGQSRVAIAAGSNLLLDPQDYIGMSNLQMLSPDSRSRMWDADANGYARGEGIAAVVLKTLSAAEADGDHIECIIRETGTNQDGRTPGITMPSASAQAQLIRDTYTRAGLEPTNPDHQPQYFEAHGTGTQAGDPVEAEAISTAFFPGQSTASDRLLVGSIKTVIGHTEGTAGLAGLLKASLALQNAIIPPNLLFNRLNPKVEPFYTNLRIPTSAVAWPVVPKESPRRASVNSFGFGGANAHVILENYTEKKSLPSDNNVLPVTPFVFSAASERSLSAYLELFCAYLRTHSGEINLRDLSMTLHSRRSRLSIATAVAASNIQDLCEKLEHKLLAAKDDANRPVGLRPSFVGSKDHKPHILGVFTGQGAQTARMGATLIERSATACRIIEKLETRLARLPSSDRPAWSLQAELLKDASSTRVAQAALSQPLCTAVQILQVELLRAAGVEFAAVVGHSSGEIGAAYAAGLISAEDAICIAYYRGLHTSLAGGRDGQAGAMMAVGTSFKDAQDLCDEPTFQGRLGVAAVNSPVSITLSGDEDAVEEAQIIFEDEHKFARRLKVDKAYHSHHMAPCSTAYLQSLHALNIHVHSPKSTWFSSVDGGKSIGPADASRLTATYWNDNMVKPVLFMQAVEGAWTAHGPFDLAIEVGPHPALKGPALQTIQEVSGREIPYIGLFARNKDDIESFADGLGYFWTHAAHSVHLTAYDKLVTGHAGFRLAQGLPTYTWDHEKEYWHESRYVKALRTRAESVHQLLGHMSPDATEQEMRWRNIVCPNEIPWLKGHALQGQTVFPAAGYVVTALEAAVALCKARDESASLIEILDLDIAKALAFDADETRIETVFSLTDILRVDNQFFYAQFKYNAIASQQGESLELLASGRIQITLGESVLDALPSRSPREPQLIEVDTDAFYSSLLELGYQYTGSFRALHGLERKLAHATGFIANEEPTILPVPPRGGIWSLHVPRTIQALRFNPALCATELARTKSVPFDCTQPAGGTTIMGDVDLFDSAGHVILQVEGLLCVPLSRPTASDDKELFAITTWDLATPDAVRIADDSEPSEEDVALVRVLERLAVFYLRQLETEIPRDHLSRKEGTYPCFFKFAQHILSLAQLDKLPLWSRQWEGDTTEELTALCQPYAEMIDVRLLKAIGENLIDIVTLKKQPIEVGMKDNMLADFYANSMGIREQTAYLVRLVKQIVHRYPNMNMLEIGAGTGGITKAIFQEIDNTLASYTYTDISSGFFEQAQQIFEPHLDKMRFQVLDIVKDPRGQDYAEHSYDLVLASLVLHATPVLEHTLRNVRRLLKPGGLLVVLELHDKNITRFGTIFGAFPGWWFGAPEGRVLSPCISLVEWDTVLRNTGFSGCDTATPTQNALVMPFTVFVSQAVDERIKFLRDPLATTQRLFDQSSLVENLILLGGGSLTTSKLVRQLKGLLHPHWRHSIQTVRSLAEMASLDLSNATVLALAELDAPVFKNLAPAGWAAFQKMAQEAKTVLWVSRGRRADNPYANMSVGLMRSAKKELPMLDMQFLDVEGVAPLDARTLAETLLQLKATTLWQRRDGVDSFLATVEPELVREIDGSVVIPRVKTSKERNDRYNSTRRRIVTTAKSENISVLESKHDPVVIQQAPVPEGEQYVRVAYSLLSAVRVTLYGCLFLILGHESGSGAQVVALANENALLVSPRISVSVAVPVGSEAPFVALVAHHLLADIVLEGLINGDTVVIHEPDNAFTTAVSREADIRGVQVVFTTGSTTTTPGWRTVHPAAPERMIRATLPTTTAAFIDFSGTGHRIRAQLPAHCRVQSVDSLFAAATAWVPHTAHCPGIRDRLKSCVGRALVDLDSISHVLSPMSLAALAGSHPAPHTVIDWVSSSGTDVTVQVLPIDTQVHFSDAQTYWLAGLSGSLGLLLAEWMVHHGAKYIVISSRNPRIDEEWLRQMQLAGAVISMFSLDVIKKQAVLEVYNTICATLPPIAGVCQGAMVLEDTLFRDMSLETLLKCTRPKVNGSLHLNELFQDVNHPLDFFIFFSSATTIPGNLGQSNYTGANMFMTALAQQRRQRGLAASVMHIGPILGVGYLAREGLTSAIQTLAKNLVFMSEQDFCTLFAEAVVASRPGTSAPLEIVSGVAKVPSPAEATPLMSHYTEPQADSVGQLGVRTGYTVPFKAQLAEARDAASVARIISAALLPKLCSLFQADLYTLEKADPATLRLDEMGIDSLLAVEIRGWFVKSIEVNIPVLKILSGVSVAELIAIATETIPPAFVPNIKMDVGEVSLDAVKSELQPEPVGFIQQPEPTTSMQQPPKKLAFEQRQSLSSSQSSVDVDDSPRTMATPADDDTDTLNSSFLSITPPMQILDKPAHPARAHPHEVCRGD